MIQKNIIIIVGSFHKKEASIMVSEAKRTAALQNLTIVKEIWVPGSLEKPLTLKHYLSSKNIDGAVVLGIIERGETKHGLVMGIAVTSAIIQIQIDTRKPIGMGILGPEILPHQINSRLKPYAKNAVLAVKTMFEVLQ